MFVFFVSAFFVEGSLKQAQNKKKLVNQPKARTVKNTETTSLSVAEFDNENNLLIPKGYREWVFVGSSLGLSYSESVTASENPTTDFYHFTYIHPKAYQEFAKTGKFPEVQY